MRLLTVDGHARKLDNGWEADIVVTVPGHWLRAGAFYGPPPGSHMGWWRTRVDDLAGINYRAQVRPPSPDGGWRCLTLLAHSRPHPRARVAQRG